VRVALLRAEHQVLDMPPVFVDPLAGAGAVFSWLGVTPYLERDAVQHTMKTVARIAGSAGRLVFDYSLPPSHLDPAQRATFDLLLKRLDALGEPFVTSFEPAEIASALAACGFASVTDLGPDALNAQYFSSRSDGLRVGTLFHVVEAAKA
jgi:O-methyltransferase involved in polyketide biosynthesis